MPNDSQLQPAEELPQETPVEEAAPEIPVQEAPAEVSAPEVPADTPVVPPSAPKKAKKVRKRPWPLKILLGLVAFVLCVVMFAVTIAGALVVDLRVMTSAGGIREILTQLILPGGSAQSSEQISVGPVLTAASGAGTASDQSGGLTGPLVDWAYDVIQDQFAEELPITKDQLTDFLEKSTAKDFISDKVAGVVEDFYNGTSNTTITREEVVQLLEDNKQLIEETFEVTITEDQLQMVEDALEKVEIFDQLEEQGLMGVIEQSMSGDSSTGGNTSGEGSSTEDDPEHVPDDDQPGSSGGSNSGSSGNTTLDSLNQVKQIMEIIRQVTADSAIAAIAGVFVALFLLLFLTNFTLPKTLSDTGIVLTVAGLILSAPNLLYSTGVLHVILAEQTAILGVLGGILSAIQVVHFSILGAGVVLIVLAIIAKLFKNARLRKAEG